jgi:uncharacterized membrane protein YGL010W
MFKNIHPTALFTLAPIILVAMVAMVFNPVMKHISNNLELSPAFTLQIDGITQR